MITPIETKQGSVRSGLWRLVSYRLMVAREPHCRLMVGRGKMWDVWTPDGGERRDAAVWPPHGGETRGCDSVAALWQGETRLRISGQNSNRQF